MTTRARPQAPRPPSLLARRLVTVKQACKFLGRSHAVLKTLVARGELVPKYRDDRGHPVFSLLDVTDLAFARFFTPPKPGNPYAVEAAEHLKRLRAPKE